MPLTHVLSQVRLLGAALIFCQLACQGRGETPVASQPVPEPRSSLHLLELYEQAELPSIAGLQRVRFLNPDYRQFHPPELAEDWVYGWLLEESEDMQRILLDSMKVRAWAISRAGALQLERERRAKIPRHLRGPATGSVPRPWQPPTLERVEFDQELGEKLDLATAHPRQRHDLESLRLQWFYGARWAQELGHTSLARRAYAQLVRTPSDTRRGCSPEDVLRKVLGRDIAGRAREQLTDWLPWAEYWRQLALANRVAGAPLNQREVDLLEHGGPLLSEAPQLYPDIAQPAAMQPDKRVAALIDLLREQDFERHGYNGTRAIDPFWELVGMGPYALPELMDCLNDSTGTRSGLTRGQMCIYAAGLIMSADDYPFALDPGPEQRAFVEGWWAEHAATFHATQPTQPPLPEQAPALPQSWAVGLGGPMLEHEHEHEQSGLTAQVVRPTRTRTGHAEGPMTADARAGGLDTKPFTVLSVQRKKGRSDRIRLLCQHSRHEIGPWVDAAALRKTNRNGNPAFVGRQPAREGGSTTPGVYFEPGSPIEVGHSRNKRTRVEYRGDDLEFRGWMRSEDVDVVYESSPREEPGQPDAALIPETLIFRDAPTGRALAVVKRPGGDAIQVRTLETRGDARLVKAYLQDATVIGWVGAGELRPCTHCGYSQMLVGKGGDSATHFDFWIDLPMGTRLVDEGGRQVLGRTTWDGSFACDGPCIEALPLVWVNACGEMLRVRAVPPT